MFKYYRDFISLADVDSRPYASKMQCNVGVSPQKNHRTDLSEARERRQPPIDLNPLDHHAKIHRSYRSSLVGNNSKIQPTTLSLTARQVVPTTTANSYHAPFRQDIESSNVSPAAVHNRDKQNSTDAKQELNIQDIRIIIQASLIKTRKQHHFNFRRPKPRHVSRHEDCLTTFSRPTPE